LRRLATILGLILAVGPTAPTRGDGPDLAELRAALANEQTPIEERVRRALEAASGLDQAAQRSNQAAQRRTLWVQAVGLLDDFVAKHDQIEAAPLLRFQAAVYRWAEGRSFADQAALAPADAKLRQGATQALDDAARRLKAIAIKPDEATEPFAQNVRFRLAQAIADRALFDPEGDPNRLSQEHEALNRLDATLTFPALLPFTRLLRAELAVRLGLFGQAQIELEQAEKVNPKPPAELLLTTKVATLSGRSRFDDATKAIEVSRVTEPFKGLLRIRVALARRKDKNPGRERDQIDDQAFQLAERCKLMGGPEGRKALMELARAIDEPTASAPAEWWDLLAEGHLRLGDPVRAGRLDAKGGDRAEALNQFERAATLRFKGAASLFEGGRFTEADTRLTELIGQQSATRELRAKAGMLRALARGRAVANRDPTITRAAYLDALEAQVRDFPADSATGEARWLLGQVRLTSGKADEAMTLWEGIRHGHPRWLGSRSIIADRLREAVEAQRINHDSAALIPKMELARSSLKTAIGEATESPEILALTLQLALLELTPEAGRPAQAIEACDQALKIAARPEQHRAARLYRIVALAESNRAVEAERAAKLEASADNPAELMPALRLLDRAASEADSELARRRIGLITRLMTTRLIDQIDQLPEGSKDEAHLHHARALLFAGDQAGARKEIAAWGGPVAEFDDELLRELADTYQRLDAHVMTIETERYRSSKLAPGSLPWFEARYGMALAYFRADKPKDARQLIDATAILHPDLGGGELKSRFERLRQKIGQD
jgi:hypothetical protein